MTMRKISLFIFIFALGIPSGSFANISSRLDIEKYLLVKLTFTYLKGNLLEDAVYEEFVSTLKFKNHSSLQTIRVLKLAIKELETAYLTEKDFNSQGKILIALDRLTQNGIVYSIRSNNILLRRFLIKFVNFIDEEHYSRFEKLEITKTAYADKEKQIEVFLFKLEAAVTRLHKGIDPNEPIEILKFRGTELQISFKEITTEDVGNVAFIVPKNNRRKIYTFQITEPSVDSAEAAYLTTKGLIDHEYVEGVYFEDPMRIPFKLTTNSYNTSYIGANVVLTRPTCSRLFQ